MVRNVYDQNMTLQVFSFFSMALLYLFLLPDYLIKFFSKHLHLGGFFENWYSGRIIFSNGCLFIQVDALKNGVEEIDTFSEFLD